ncbi:MAG: ABC transporter substrate-binding protein, partial [Candidatus Limnocylindrales bacterium]
VKRWASVLAVMALVAVACGSSSATGASVKNGGTLTVALDGDMHYADPSVVSDASSLYIADQVVEGLVGIRPGSMSDIVPVLASALPDVSSDGLTYTFKLRSGIRFHDGTEFNAAAVKFNYDRVRNFPEGELRTNAAYYALVFGAFGASSNLAQVEARDASTVVFHLQHAQSNFLISQTVAAFGIQSPAAIAANDGNNANLAMNPYAMGRNGQGKAMVGTGPFMFSEWKPGDHVTLVKNPDYWNPVSGPYLDRIVFKPFADSASKLKALQSGAVDIADSLDPAGIGTVAKDSNLMVLDRGPGCNLTQLAMNDFDTVNGLPNLLSNQGVRFAIAAAVNKPAYINAHYGGQGSVADSWLPAGAQYYKREYLPTYNLSASRAYLAGAGVPTSGLAVDLWYPTGAPVSLFPDPKGLAQAIALDLQAAGFVVTLRTEAYNPTYASDEAGGVLQMWLRSQNCRWAGPDDFLYAPFKYVPGLPTPMFSYKNDALSTLLVTAAGDTNVASAEADWHKVQDLIAVGMPTVPLLDAKSPVGARRYVMGFVGSGNRTEVLSTVWLNK